MAIIVNRVGSLWRRRSSYKRARVWVPALIVVMLATGVTLSFLFGDLHTISWASLWDFWGWLSDGESGSRNVGLVIAGLIALPLTLWRSISSHRHAVTGQQGLLN